MITVHEKTKIKVFKKSHVDVQNRENFGATFIANHDLFFAYPGRRSGVQARCILIKYPATHISTSFWGFRRTTSCPLFSLGAVTAATPAMNRPRHHYFLQDQRLQRLVQGVKLPGSFESLC